jgi:hypothetical protein
VELSGPVAEVGVGRGGLALGGSDGAKGLKLGFFSCQEWRWQENSGNLRV